MVKNDLGVSRNGDSYISNHWRVRGVLHLDDHASRRTYKGNFVREPLRTNGRSPLRTGFDHFLIGKIVSRKMSRSMSRRQNRIETHRHLSKLDESTLHSELRRFRELQPLRICWGRVHPRIELALTFFCAR